MGSGSREEPSPEIRLIECKGCGRCVLACPKGVMCLSEEVNDRGFHFVQYRGEGCTGCGNCFYACPEPNTLQIRIPGRE